MKNIFLTTFLSFLLFTGATAFAQFNAPLETSIDFRMNPENPGPNQFVAVSINSFSTDLNAAVMTWKVDGKIVKSGTGVKNFSFYTKGTGVSTNLQLTIRTSEGEVITKEYEIRPSSVDLLWEAEGYVPPFYKGKNMFNHQDTIKFVAIPHIMGNNGQEIPASNLIYTWTKNGTVLGDYNGYGRSTYSMVGSIISRPLDIEVEVTSPDSAGSGSAAVNVRPTKSDLLFYRKDPLNGVQFQKALVGTVPMNNLKEMEVVAAPYYFGAIDPQNGSLQYSWTLNNSQIDTGKNQSKVFRQPEESSGGTSYIKLSVTSFLKELQEASAGFSLQF